MFWRRRMMKWSIEPSSVAFGSVVEDRSRNLSRSHVRVKYRHDSKARFVPLTTFMQYCAEFSRGGRRLDIEHLLVAPVLKQRYASFFDGLTDWGPATRTARRVSRPHFGRRPKSTAIAGQ